MPKMSKYHIYNFFPSVPILGFGILLSFLAGKLHTPEIESIKKRIRNYAHTILFVFSFLKSFVCYFVPVSLSEIKRRIFWFCPPLPIEIMFDLYSIHLKFVYLCLLLYLFKALSAIIVVNVSFHFSIDQIK